MDVRSQSDRTDMRIVPFGSSSTVSIFQRVPQIAMSERTIFMISIAIHTDNVMSFHTN